MPNLTTIGVTSGIPTSGTGTVSTIDNLMAQLALGPTPVSQFSTNWVVRVQDGAGNAISSDTRGAKQALAVEILDASGNQITSFGGGAPVTEPTTQTRTGTPNVPIDQYGQYKPVAASQTTALLGASGAQYDYLAGILIVPASTSPGNVLIRDGSGGSDMTIFTGGATSVGDLHPFMVPLGIYALASSSPGWRVTTGANVSVIAIGNFT